MLLQLAPAGSFAAVAGDRIIGTAIGIDYGTFGWIAMMLVDPAWRGRGMGARLLEEAMGAVPPEIPIRLDATPLGRPLYRAIRLRRRGRADASCRRAVDAAVPSRSRTSRRGYVRGLTHADLPAVIARTIGSSAPTGGILLEWALDGAAAVRACDRHRRRRALLFRTSRASLRSDWSGGGGRR